MKVVAKASQRLFNSNDIYYSDKAPEFPECDQMWTDTSKIPPVLMRYDCELEEWVENNWDIEELDPEYVDKVEQDILKKHQDVLDEVDLINKAAEDLKQTVLDNNERDTKYFEEVWNNIDKVEADLDEANEDIIFSRGEYLGLYGDINGKHSILAQNVNGIATRVTDAEKNISTVTQTATALGVKLTSAEGNINSLIVTSTSLSNRISNAEGNYSSLLSTVNGLQSTVNSVTNGTHSVITQMSDRINLRVTKGDVINQISVEADKGVYIAGKAIYLDGTVKVSDTFVAPRIISTNSSNTAYTKIEGQQLTSYGYFSNNWRGITYAGYHSLEAKVGYIKMKQLTGGNTNALYYSAKGISTRMDADGNGTASGIIEFFAPGYSTMSNSLVFASSGNIVLESTSGSNIFLNPFGAKVSVSDIVGNRYKLECGSFDCYNISAMDIDCGTLTPYKISTPAWLIGETNINSANGKIKIGNSGNITITGTLSQGSQREIKKNIKPFEKSGLDIINSASIREFNYLDDVDNIDMPRIGLIVDEAPVEVVDINDGGVGVQAFDGIWLSWKAIQELHERISILEGK